MSSTIAYTQTQPDYNVENHVLSFRAPTSTSLLDRLAGILEKFNDWRDPLSLDLYKWGANVLVVTATIEETDLYEFQQNAQEELNILKNEILIDSFTQCPFQSPVLVEEFTWEEKVINQFFLNHEVNQDLSNAKKLPVVKIHQFAKEMIRWLNDTNEKVNITKMNNELIDLSKTTAAYENAFFELSNQQMPLEEKNLIWNMLINQAKMIQRKKMVQQSFEREHDFLEKAAQELRNICEEKKKEFEANLEQTKKETNERLEGILEETRKSTEALKGQISVLNENHKQDKKNISELKNDSEEKGAQIRSLLLRDRNNILEIQRLREEKQKRSCIIQ